MISLCDLGLSSVGYTYSRTEREITKNKGCWYYGSPRHADILSLCAVITAIHELRYSLEISLILSGQRFFLIREPSDGGDTERWAKGLCGLRCFCGGEARICVFR